MRAGVPNSVLTNSINNTSLQQCTRVAVTVHVYYQLYNSSCSVLLHRAQECTTSLGMCGNAWQAKHKHVAGGADRQMHNGVGSPHSWLLLYYVSSGWLYSFLAVLL